MNVRMTFESTKDFIGRLVSAEQQQKLGDAIHRGKDFIGRLVSAEQQQRFGDAIHRGIEYARYLVRVGLILADDLLERTW